MGSSDHDENSDFIKEITTRLLNKTEEDHGTVEDSAAIDISRDGE